MALRIGVNALYLIPGGVGGTEIYLRNLLRALAGADKRNQYFVVSNRETTDLTPGAANMHALPQNVPGRVRPARILWEQTVLPALAARHGWDVLLNAGFTAPLLCPCPQVTVFHDVQHKRHPENFRWFDLPFWNVLLYGAVKRSARLIADSEATRADLLRYYGAQSSVVPLGIEAELFAIADQRAPEPFLLCVSTLHPHKGIETLLDAFARFRKTSPGFRLVLAGMRGFATGTIEERVRALGLEDAVTITGWIPREDLYDLYRRAWALVYPSRFEGFGMPVSEAMAAGVPVACSAIEPLQSVAGDAALFFIPSNEQELESALQRITADADLRAQLTGRGRERAAQFTWRASAIQTVAVLEQAATQAGWGRNVQDPSSRR